MYAIETKNLTKKYKDVVAVDSINLQVCKGDLFALLGLNGAGKTTTINMLSCLVAPSNGDAFVCGSSIVSQAPKVKSVIGVSPQETALAPTLTVKENLQFVCGIYGFSKQQTNARVQELVTQLGLDEVLSKNAGKLSGGWQRRVSIAMALISSPSVLFLDEPTLGLDVIAKNDLWQIIRSLKGKTTIVLTTHNMNEAQTLADKVGVMRNGRLLVVGSPIQIVNQTGVTNLEQAFVKIVGGGVNI